MEVAILTKPGLVLYHSNITKYIDDKVGNTQTNIDSVADRVTILESQVEESVICSIEGTQEFTESTV